MTANSLEDYHNWLDTNGSFEEKLDYVTLKKDVEKSLSEGNPTKGFIATLVLANHYLSEHQYEEGANLCLQTLDANIEDEEHFAELHYLLGRLRMYQGAYGNAVEHLFRSLRVSQRNRYEKLEGRTYTGLASISRFLKHYEKAQSYSEKAILLSEKHNDFFNLSETYMGSGIVFNKINEQNKSISSLEKAEQYANKIENSELNCSIVKSFGDTFYKFHSVSEAIDKYNLALEILKGIDNRMMKAIVNVRLADCLFQNKDFISATKHAQEGANIATDINFLHGQSEAELLLSRITESQEKPDEAFIHLKNHVQVNMDINSKVDPGTLINIESGYLIELKEKEINLLREVEVRHQEISDSISYASKIQGAILPKQEFISSGLENHFIMYRPKEVVSGDFYWYHERDQKIFIIAADCTGHGIPGALVSMLCHDILNQVIIDYKVTSPGEILSQVNARLVSILKSDFNKNQANDGMDVAMCVIDKEKKTLSFSGAINSLTRVRDNEWEEFKGMRTAIGGGTPNDLVFQTFDLEIESNDWFYIYTDGFQDQFGGPKNKKFMAKNFRRLLVKISSLNKNEQLAELKKVFNDWEGDNEQIDDVLVIGFKVD
jgi:serine phosphatase RsbU (regulator of sigma subunit)